MGNQVAPKRSGKSALRMTHLMAALCFMLAAGSGLAAWWITSSKKQNEIPVLALASLIGDARAYQSKKGSFPDNLARLQNVVWNKRGKFFTLTEANRSFFSDNCYYLYTPAGPQVVNIWAVPLGPYREHFPTLYVNVRTGDPNPTIWQGAALSHEQLKKVQGLMTDKGLIELGMKLQPAPAAQPQTQAQSAPFPFFR